MSPSTPVGKCAVTIEGFGRLEGWQYPDGVRQFCGVPYATLDKRWTRSVLKTTLDGGFHDGTKLGARCPHPEFEGDDGDDLVPVPPFAHFNTPVVDEKAALVMNIVLPPSTVSSNIPIFVYVHGGSLLYGGAYLPIFDAVHLVSQSVGMGRPIIAINFNYRVGLGGFLASKAIQEELSQDGFAGCGNFGFTDQRVAFDWVQTFGAALGGNIESVTAVGESAGGISISNQLLARSPPIFHRAVCMSGLASSIPAWSIEKHETLFEATCKHFRLNARAPNILDQLRTIPEQVLADATPEIFGVPSGSGNPCLDDWFYALDPLDFHEVPSWLKSYMIGDVYHEGVIFHLNIMDDTFDIWRSVFTLHFSDEKLVDQIFRLYGLSPDLPHEELLARFEHMAGDAIFRIPNYLTARYNRRLRSDGEFFTYHFDQISRIQNTFEGTAYHAHELLYLFRNLEDQMNQDETKMAHDLAAAWINFTHGIAPWQSTQNAARWKIWGPNSRQTTSTEAEDEHMRSYSRFETMLRLGGSGRTWKQWLIAIDEIVNKRMRLGKGLCRVE